MMNDYDLFIKKIKDKSGIDLSLYKETQMKRRLESLYEKKGYKNFNTFFAAMDQNKALYDEFLDRITINVSEFFRNFSRWDVLQKKVLPLVANDGRTIKVWSAACSTGEEPYTLAIILAQMFPKNRIQIMATDIDEGALQRAKNGIYSERSLQEVPKEIKKRFFNFDGIHYRVQDEIKQLVTFKKHNLLNDPFPSDMDLIVCRNVLIYFKEEAKDQLYHKFSQSLKRNGFFFVGSTEQIFNPQRYGFTTFDTFFYRKQ